MKTCNKTPVGIIYYNGKLNDNFLTLPDGDNPLAS